MPNQRDGKSGWRVRVAMCESAIRKQDEYVFKNVPRFVDNVAQEAEHRIQEAINNNELAIGKSGKRNVDLMRHLDGEIELQDIEQQPIFACDINVQAGMLEEITSFPSLTGENRKGTTEVGMKLSLASYDEEQGEMTLDVGLDVLAEIDQSVREREEHLAHIQALLNSRE